MAWNMYMPKKVMDLMERGEFLKFLKLLESIKNSEGEKLYELTVVDDSDYCNMVDLNFLGKTISTKELIRNKDSMIRRR